MLKFIIPTSHGAITDKEVYEDKIIAANELKNAYNEIIAKYLEGICEPL